MEEMDKRIMEVARNAVKEYLCTVYRCLSQTAINSTFLNWLIPQYFSEIHHVPDNFVEIPDLIQNHFKAS